MRKYLVIGYCLVLALAGTPVFANGGESEPNNTMATADEVFCDDLIDGAIIPGDVDYFRLDLPGPACIRATVLCDVNNDAGKIDFALISPSKSGFLVTSTGGATGIFCPFLDEPREGGTHYLVVTGKGDGNDGELDGIGHSETFAYTLEVLCDTAYPFNYQLDGGGRVANDDGGQSTFRFFQSGFGYSCEPPADLVFIDDLFPEFGAFDGYNYKTRKRMQAFSSDFTFSSFQFDGFPDPTQEWRAIGFAIGFVNVTQFDVFVYDIEKFLNTSAEFRVDIRAVISGAQIKGKIIPNRGSLNLIHIP